MKTLSELKKGDIFSFLHKKKVYVFFGKSKRKGLHYHAYDDINDVKTTKNGNRAVDVDITF